MTARKNSPRQAQKLEKKKVLATVSPKEKSTIDYAVAELNQSRMNMGHAERRLVTALELVGDRYGVDLRSGNYEIDGDGNVIERPQSPKNEASKGTGEQQLLTEG